MKEYRGKKHDYIGMDLDLLVDGYVSVTMTDYPKKIVSDFTETIQGRVKTPASEHLFTAREDTDRKLLEKE